MCVPSVNDALYFHVRQEIVETEVYTPDIPQNSGESHLTCRCLHTIKCSFIVNGKEIGLFPDVMSLTFDMFVLSMLCSRQSF